MHKNLEVLKDFSWP